MTSTGTYVVGLLFIAWSALGALAAGVIIVRRWLGELSGSLRMVAVGIVAAAAQYLTLLVPGALGLLTRDAQAVTTALVLGAVVLIGRARVPGTAERDTVTTPRSSRIGLAAAAVAWILLLGQALATLYAARGTAPWQVDLLTNHLTVVTRWMQTRSLWHDIEYTPYLATGTYPQNSEFGFLAVLLPLHHDVFVRMVPFAWWAFTGLAAYAFAREFGAARSTAAVLAAALAATYVVGNPALASGLPDTELLACFIAGATLLIRHRRTARRAGFVLAGIALGLAFGSKWYGVTAVPLLVLVWAVGTARARRAVRSVLRELGVVVGLVAAFGGFWILRNWIATGDPVFPSSVRLAGLKLFTGPPDLIRQKLGGTVADYITDFQVVRHSLVPSWRVGLGRPGALLVGAIVVALVMWCLRRRADDRLARLSGYAFVVCGLALVAYVVTPDTAFGPPGHPELVAVNSRYAMPALAIGLGPLAWASRKLRRPIRVAFEVLAAVLVAVVVRRTLSDPTVNPGGGPHLSLWCASVVAACALGAVAARKPRTRRRVALGVAVLAGGFVAVLGRDAITQHGRARYGAEPPIALLAQTSGRPRVGMTGYWPSGTPMPYPAFGPRLSSTVVYIGGHQRGGLRLPTRSQFDTALGTQRFRYLAIGLQPAIVGPRPPLLAWAQADGWRILARDAHTAVLTPPNNL